MKEAALQLENPAVASREAGTWADERLDAAASDSASSADRQWAWIVEEKHDKKHTLSTGEIAQTDWTKSWAEPATLGPSALDMA